MLGRLATIAVLAFAASPAVASAAEIHVAPDGAAFFCSASQPCDIEVGINLVADDNDEIILAPGIYTTDDELEIAFGIDDVTIRPRDPGTRPVIVATDPFALTIAGFDATFRNIEIRNETPASGTALLAYAEGARIRNVVATANGIGCQLGNATMTDSICRSTGQFGEGLRVNVAFGNRDTVVRNSTLLAPGKNAVGLDTSAQEPTDLVHIDVSSSIIEGGLADVRAYTFDGAGGAVDIDLANSNFESTIAQPGGSVTSPFTAGNQTAEPIFANAAYEQAPGSPTIDAGAVDGFTGSTDVYGDARPQGAANDIGADELPVAVPPADTTAPDTFITEKPKRKVKKRTAKFEFAATEPGSTFECKVDKGPFTPCDAATKLKKLKRRKHALEVRAVDAAGNKDQSPATHVWKVKKKPKK